jgi:phosphatidylinositol alpha-1,6-mannosyltransferase
MSDALMVTSSFLPGRGGIESYLAELCDALAPRLSVLAAAERDSKRLSDLDLSYVTHPFDGRLLWPGRAALGAIVAAAAREGTDKVLFGTPWPLVLLGPRLRKEGLRYSVIVHGAELTVPGAIPGPRGRVAESLAGADLLLPVSEYTRGKVEALLSRKGARVPHIELLRARVDLGRFHPDAGGAAMRARLGLGPTTPVLLCFGRLVPRKGVDRLIEALPDIRARVDDAIVVVAGTGPEERRLRRLAEKVGDGVVFAGRVHDDDAPATYAAADVFVLPVVDRWFGLEMEGLGVVLLEAAAAGVPAVTGRSGGTPEAVVDRLTGFVVDATDRSALVDRIVWLLEHPEEATAMGGAGRRHVEAEFARGSLPEGLLDWLGLGLPSS